MTIAATANAAEMISRSPAVAGQSWSRITVALLALTGLITPYVCFAAAPVAFANSDQDDGLLLAGIGGAHMLLSWAIFGTI